MKDNIEAMQIALTEEEIEQINSQWNSTNTMIGYKGVARPKLNFVISSYYKGTGLEEVLKKLEEYLDNANMNESEITNI